MRSASWSGVEFRAALLDVAGALGLELEPEVLEGLERHARLLVEWNARVNLTRIVNPVAVAFRHFGESLAVANALPTGGHVFVDVGSGGGFPGAAAGLLRPDSRFVLLEPRGKKAVFLKEVTRRLPHVAVETLRLEEWSGRANGLMSRAVRPDDVLSSAAVRGIPAWVLVGADVAAEFELAFTAFPWDATRGVANTVPRGTSDENG